MTKSTPTLTQSGLLAVLLIASGSPYHNWAQMAAFRPSAFFRVRIVAQEMHSIWQTLQSE